MSDLMDDAVIGMPYGMAMGDELSRLQFHLRAQGVLAELRALQAQINSPQTKDWVESSKMEAQYQLQEHGPQDSKTPEEWVELVHYLSGKALTAFENGDREKGLHHIISTSAALLNWHRTVTKEKNHEWSNQN